jgi:hypothetical protein
MKPAEFNLSTDPVPEPSSNKKGMALTLDSLKVNLMLVCHALGNVMLLIGGDDSVEIGFKSCPLRMQHYSLISLTDDNTEGSHL